MGERPVGRWLAVAVWISVIFAAIPFVRSMRDAFTARWPAEIIGVAVMGTVAAAAVGALLASRTRRRTLRIADAVWLGGIAAVVIVWTRALMGRPEEAVHFLEYGVLGILLYRALRLNIDDPGVYVIGVLVGMIVGTTDEVIQWIVPERLWDFRDLVLNGCASALVQIALWRLTSNTSSSVTLPTVRLVIRLAATEMLLLTVCLAATPQRLASLAPTFPALGPLATGDDVIAEYGFMHRLSDRTRFRSRLTRHQLDDEDSRRSDDVAATVDRSGGRYREFLRSVSPTADPFAYEARIHIIARNRSLAEARRNPTGSRQQRRSMTEAARENQILERAFGTILDLSKFRWTARLRSAVESAQDPEVTYVSRVARHLITRVSEQPLRVIMLAIIIVLVIVDLALGRRIRVRRAPTSPG